MTRQTTVVAGLILASGALSAWAQQPATRTTPVPLQGDLRSAERFYAQESEFGWYRPGHVIPKVLAVPEPEPAAAAPAPQPQKAQAQKTQPQTTAAAGGLAIPTGERSTSSLWVEKVIPREVVANQAFEYEIRATNLTGTTLENVTVWDSVPTNFKFTSMSPEGRPAPQGMLWTLGSLAPHETKSVLITGAAPKAGSVDSCAGGSFTMSLCTAIPVVQPALQLTKTVGPEATVCQTVPVKLVVTNSGTGQARNVRITDTLGPGLKTADGRTAVEFNAGTLAAGQSREFAFDMKADRPGTYHNVAMAAADGGLQAMSRELSATFTQPVLSLKMNGPERLYLGKAATYELTISNNGDAVSVNTILENPLPTGADFVAASDGGRLEGGTVRWSLGNLPPKGSKVVSITLNSGAIGEIRNAATVKGVCADPAAASASTQMAGIPALLLDGIDSPDPVQLGDSVVYTLTVTNQGSVPLTNVRLVCTMDEGGTMEYASSSGMTTGTPRGNVIIFAPIAKLEPKAKATYKVTVKAVKEGQVQLRAEAVSDQINRPLLKVETTNFYR